MRKMMVKWSAAGWVLSLLVAVAVEPGASWAQAAPPAGPGQAVTPPASEAGQAPNLAGRWELNAQASDPQPSDTPPSGGGEGGGRRGGGGGGGGRGGGGGMGGRGGGGMGGGGMGGRGGMGGGGGSEESTAAREEMRRALEAPRVLLIVQHETALSLTDEEGRVVSLKPDGAKVKEEEAGATIERTTKWDGRSLVTVTKLTNGAKVTQTFTKIAEGLQLVVVTKIEGGRRPTPLEIKRVYDQPLQVS
jgi:hypothetical protein